MARHGFRVFSFTARKNGRGDPVDLSLSAHQQQLALAVQHIRYREGWPNRSDRDASEGAEAEPEIPTMTVLWADWIAVNHLHVRVTFGEQGLHHRLARPGGQSEDIRNAAAEGIHRLDIIFPNDGETGMIVMETVDGRDHMPLVRQWLNAVGRQLRDRQKEADQRRRRALREAGEKPPKASSPAALVIKVGRLADPEQLARVIQMAKKTEVEFSQFEQSDRAGEGVVKKRRLRLRLTDDLEFERAIAFVNGWWRTLNEDDTPRIPMGDAVLQVGDAFGVEDDDRYDEVKIEVTPQVGSPRSFSPDVMREIFTYTLTQGRTSMVYYYQEVVSKVLQLALANRIALDIGAGEEVRECLEGLIHAHSSEESVLESGGGVQMETSQSTGEPGES